MGVTGLTTFLSKCGEKYTDPIYVHNKVVVVDGCNLMYHLYFHGSVTRFSPHLFGGDCISFAQKVREYFQKLKLCNILPIVIFDGAYEAGKLKTVMKRFGKSLKENVQNKIPGKSYTSVLIKLVFLEILVEQNIDHFQSEFEADDTIAFVAKKLRAPVLSSDSDFFIYSSITTIPLNTIDFKRVQLKKDGHDKKTQKVEDDTNVKPFCLVGKSITLREMCQKEFRLADYRLLPLTVVVIGNDQISSRIFSKFMNTKGGGFKVKKNDRISFLLKWFGRQLSYDMALEVMLCSVKEVEREKVRELVQQVVKNYMSDGGEEHVWNLIKSSKSIIQNQVDVFINDDNENTVESEVVVKEEEEERKDNEVNERRKKNKATEISLCELLEDMALRGKQSATNNQKDQNNENEEVKEEEEDDDSPYDSEDNDDDDDDGEIANNNEFKQVKNLPEWYLKAHRKCDLLTYLIKIFSNRALFLTPQVEMTTMPSSHAISVPIIQVTGGILCGAGTFTLVTRIKADIEKLEVPNIICLPNYGQLPLVTEESIDFRTSLTHEKRLKIILEALQITSPSDIGFINEWPQFLKFWIATCLYYVRKLRKTNGYYIAVSIALSIIISLLKLYSFPTNPNTKQQQQQPQENNLLNTININDNNKNSEGKIVESISNLLKRQSMDAKLVKLFKIFDYVPEFKGKSFWKSYDISRVFYFSQYQSVIYHTYMLNILLGTPLKTPKLSTLNSHTIYNICTKITEIYHGKVSQFINKEIDSELPIKTILIKFIQYATGSSDISTCDAKLNSNDNECKRSSKNKTKRSFRHEDSTTQLNRFMSLADGEEHS